MNRIACILFLIVLFIETSFSQSEKPQVKNEAWEVGEKLLFRFYYDAWLTGKVTAGYGSTEIKETNKNFNAREVYHIEAKGWSKGMFNWFFKVDDQFNSYIDREYLSPHYFTRKTREGGYKKDDEYTFDQLNQIVTTRSDTVATPPHIQDFISAIFFTRTFNSDTLEEGDRLPVNFFLDDSVYTSMIIYEGVENIQIKLGSFRCLRFAPMMATGEVFSDSYPMTLWVTDDKNHLPILGKSAIVVGNLKMELVEYEGIANPLDALIELN